jgi:hypothetical protein
MVRGRSGIDSQGATTESTGLSNLNNLSNNRYSQDQTYNDLEQQGYRQTNDANYQSMVNQGTAMATGQNTISPLLQQQMMRAGLSGAAQSLGASNLGSGTAGNQAVARNLGNSITAWEDDQRTQGENLLSSANAYQNAGNQQMQTAQSGQSANAQNYATVQGSNRSDAEAQTGGGQSAQNTTSALQQALNNQYQNSAQSYQQGQALTSSQQGQAYNQDTGYSNYAAAQNTQAQSTYPHQYTSDTGANYLSMWLSDYMNGQNSDVQRYAAGVQNAAYRANQGSQQAQADQAASNSNMQQGATAAAIGATAAAAACWVARSVYGWQNPKWQHFRAWLLLDAPGWFRRFYLKHGPQIAQWLDAHPWAKGPVRASMDAVLSINA